MELGEIMREYRLARGLSQAALGRTLGISGSHVGSIERNELQMQPHQIARLRDDHPDLFVKLAHVAMADFRAQLGIDAEDGVATVTRRPDLPLLREIARLTAEAIQDLEDDESS